MIVRNQEIYKSSELSNRLKDKIGLSTFLKKTSFIGACGFVNALMFLMKNAYKQKLGIDNDYINAYLNIVSIVNNHFKTTITYFLIAIVVYLFLYCAFFELANKYSSEVFWIPCEIKETNFFKRYWNKILRDTVFYKRITGEGIKYFVSGKYFNWIENTIIALKRIGLFALKAEVLFFTFLYLKGNGQWLTMVIIYVTFAAALFDSYRLVFMKSGIPLQINLYNLANNFMIINKFEGYFNNSKTLNGKESGIYRIMKYKDTTSEIYYLVFFSTTKTYKDLPSVEERFLYLQSEGVEKYFKRFQKENYYFLFPELNVTCYGNSYASMLSYVKNSELLSGEPILPPIRIN